MNYLAAVVVLFCFLHRREAFIPVLALVSINTCYSYLAPFLGDSACYIVAGCLDMAFIFVLTSFYWEKEFSLDLCALALLSMACNFFGYLMYNAYQSPFLYNSASIIIIILQLLRLLVERNDGDTAGSGRLSVVRFAVSPSLQSNHGKDSQKEGGEA